MTHQIRFLFLFSILVIWGVPNSWGHKGHVHEDSHLNEKILREARFSEINRTYIQKIKPIFAKKCFDCHSNQTRYPWYHSLPGIKQWLDHDISEGKKHIDFSIDFPFQGHGTPLEDLQAIRDSVETNSMPPFAYILMHTSSKISKTEREAIILWTNESENLLK